MFKRGMQLISGRDMRSSIRKQLRIIIETVSLEEHEIEQAHRDNKNYVKSHSKKRELSILGNTISNRAQLLKVQLMADDDRNNI